MAGIIRSMKRQALRKKEDVPKVRSITSKRQLIYIAEIYARYNISPEDDPTIILDKLSNSDIKWTLEEIIEVQKIVLKFKTIIASLIKNAVKRNALSARMEQIKKASENKIIDTKENTDGTY